MAKMKSKRRDVDVDVDWEDWGDDEFSAQKARTLRGGNKMEIRPGDNYLRFLPPLKGTHSHIVDVREHFFGGDDLPIPGHDGYVSYACPEMEGEHCKACERARELMSSRSVEDRELAFLFKPRLKGYANVIDMEDQSAGPKVYAFPSTVYYQLMEIRDNKRKGGNFTHPETGRVIIVNKKGDKKSTKYTVSVDSDGPNELEDYGWIKQQTDLSTYVRFPSADDEKLGLLAISALLGESETPKRKSLGDKNKDGGRLGKKRVDDDDDDDDDDDVPPPKKKFQAPPKKKRPVVEDDDDWGDEDDDDDDIPPPKKKFQAPLKKGKARAQDLIEDDDDWEDDDDD